LASMRVSEERVIPATADQVYALLADYHVGHPSILPPAFSHYRVLEGGTGAGTRIQFDLTLGGRTLEAKGLVTEPEPGRVLVETYEQNDMATTFTVDPIGLRSRLRIETVWESSPGPRGFVERLLAPRMLQGLFRQEMGLIARRLAGASGPAPP
jgi:Polyketide cyclase / dehydrase and lipid transport